MFVTQSLKLTGQEFAKEGDAHYNHIQRLGLIAGSCLEATARQQLALPEQISCDQYALLITHIKNCIGGDFSPAPAADRNSVRVINHRCPFGERVRDSPELCRMTSSVFGGIAARNFGYAKVNLRKRIAVGDGQCEVVIYMDRDAAQDRVCDEYFREGEAVISRSSSVEMAERLTADLGANYSPGGASGARDNIKIIAESAAMREALKAVEQVAPTMANVLISGETGVGKEIIARAIHALSNRCGEKFLAVNCGAIPDNLMESALFGHEKGAFTGAHESHRGYFERAANGTLFLDEIDSLPLMSQANLLRVLQEGEFERVGGTKPLRCDVRIVAATNRSIEDLVALGEFRKDLYYRLNVVGIHIPALRERREDITPLVAHILKRIAARCARQPKVMGVYGWSQIMSYNWPGNVRELENVLERACIFTPGEIIMEVGRFVNARADPSEPTNAGDIRTLKRLAAQDVEVKALQAALARHNGKVSAVATDAAITRRAVNQKLKKYGINAASYRR
jgi:transcriptional regulator with PAS, ATPase and Fis domain